MNDMYLIPANSKKSMMIFGMFYPFDLILLGCGCGITFLLLLALDMTNLWISILAIMPAVITGLLVFPVPNYHNILTIISEVWIFYTTRQKFVWKGWCVQSEIDKLKK